MKYLLIDDNINRLAYLSALQSTTVITYSPVSQQETEDQKISSFIKNYIDVEENITAIIIPFALTENYLEFSGLRLAHHLRLQSKYSHFPIIFTGELTPLGALRLTKLADILLTPSIHYCKPDLVSMGDFLLDKSFLHLNSSSSYLKRISIEPPSNYQSHHSVNNELALMSWSELIGCDHLIPEVKLNLQTSLYFKYLRATKGILESEYFEIPNFDLDAKVLLIDDEWEKGWNKFYETYFFKSRIDYRCAELNFSVMSRTEILDSIKATLLVWQPDVVLLDLRLSDDDFVNKTHPEEMTGAQILTLLKEANKGIQVIVLSASDKVWNASYLSEKGASNYIPKSPEIKAAESIRELSKSLIANFEKAIFLKEVFAAMMEIRRLWENNSDVDKELNIKFSINLDVAFKLLEDYRISSKYLNYGYLQLFLIVEDFANSSFETGDSCFVTLDQKKHLVLQKANISERPKEYRSALHYNQRKGRYELGASTYNEHYIVNFFKVSAILFFGFGCSSPVDIDWKGINNTRNRAAHAEEGELTKSEVLKLLKFMKFIFDISNYSDINAHKVLGVI